MPCTNNPALPYSTFLRRLVLLWIRFCTSCRQWTSLSSGKGVKSVLAEIPTEGSLFSVTGLESSCAARARTWCTKNKKSLKITLVAIVKRAQINHCMHLVRANGHCCFHLQDIEPLAKTVVQRVKLCGQILSHLSGKAERVKAEKWDRVVWWYI